MYLLSAASLLCFFSAPATQATENPRIAIIIDDLGYTASLGQRVTELPGPIACAVLPATPFGKALAEAANAAGKEVLLHLPLEAMKTQATVDPGGIVLDMSRGQFAKTFAEDIRAIPHVIGVNNHRGSLLTRHPGHMTWLMEEIKARGNLFFVDSYTTRESIALKLAIEAGIPAIRRDVFLDPDESPETVAREFQRLKQLARKRGMAVAIGHPYPATIELLENELPQLAKDGFDLVRLSDLMSPHPGRRSAQEIALSEANVSRGLAR